jgi:signal transduction histidine kinase/CheY-like chemotaxis protein
LAKRVRVLRWIAALLLGTGTLPAVADDPASETGGPALTSIQAFSDLTAEQRQRAWPLDLVCDVIHYDPIWPQLWIRDATAGAYVDIVGERLPMRAGQRVRVRGTVRPPNLRFTFDRVSVEVLGDAPLSAVPLEDWRETNPALLNRLVVAEGIVDRQTHDISDPVHLRLFLSVEGRSVVAWIYDPELADRQPDLTDSLVRVTGVYNPRSDTIAPKSLELMVSGIHRVEVTGHLTRDSRFDRPAVAIEDLRWQPRDALVRIVGQVYEQQAGRLLRLRDGTGQVDVLSAQSMSLAARERVEAIGLPRIEGVDVRLVEAVFRRLQSPVPQNVAEAQGERRLAADVLELPAETAAAGLPVQLRGVVTWSHPDHPYIYVQDNTGGVRVLRGSDPGKVRPPGRNVEVRGVTVMGRFAPEVLASEVVKLGESIVPEARPISLEHALSGVEESQWVMMHGYVRAIESRTGAQGQSEQVILLATAAGDFEAMVPTLEDLRSLEHAVVNLRGVCTARTDEAGKLLGITLLVPDAEQIQVEEPAPADVFAIPARSLESLGRFGTTRAFNRRIKVEGSVVYAGAGRFVVQDKGVALVALTRESELPRPGDRVEAVGFFGRQGPRVVLRETVHRRLGPGDPIEPAQVENMGEADPALDGHLVRVSGGVLDSAYVGTSLVLTVQRGTAVFPAQLAGTGLDVRKGSEVLLTGIYDVRFDEYGRARSFALLMRDGGDLVVIRPPSPFTTRRVLTFSGMLAAVTVGIVGWVVALRRRVRRQTKQIREQLEREGHLQRELERSQRLESLGHLAGGIAHDFNNLLTVVMGNISLARADAGIGAENRESLGDAERAIMRARDLTQQLLTFSKGGAPIRAATDLAGVVREVAEFVLHGSPVRPEFRFAPNLWPADVDKGQIGQVVQNIVLNGAQSMPEGGLLQIELANDEIMPGAAGNLAPGRYLRLVMRDRGRGISAQDLPRIFDPYFTTKAQGSGLGLATVYSIVKRHGGEIAVESTVGRGTCFRLWLPAANGAAVTTAPAVSTAETADVPSAAEAVVAQTVAAPVSHAAPKPAANGMVRVLVMDDESSIRRLAQTILRRAGYDVTAVGDGAEAVREYAEARASGRGFSVVVFDLTVPGGMGGRQALAELRKIDPAVRAIVSSGYSNDPSLADHRELGFVAMVAKPYEVKTLVATVRTVLQDGAE